MSVDKDASIKPERLRRLPRLPGVYLMKDQSGKVLYVGKAKNLRARVRSYFNLSDSRYKVQFLVEQVYSLETVVTVDERAALILENDLIKRHQPRYNARLKDDRSHLIVRVDHEQPFPRLELVRRMQADGAQYLGPFTFAGELKTVLEVIKRSVPLRTCTDSVMGNRVRPCLEYQIKRCLGPCCLPVDQREYAKLIAHAVAILEGKSDAVIQQLTSEMNAASEALRYEDAAVIRDRLAVLEKVRRESPAENYGLTPIDVFGLYREGLRAEVCVLSVRDGRLSGGRTFAFSELSIPDDELIRSVLLQLYADADELPDDIVVPIFIEDRSALTGLFTERRGRTVSLRLPKRGKKLELLRLAEENARENFLGRSAGNSSADIAVTALASELGLEQVPRTIECVDISHFQGGQTVGSVVLFQDGKADRSRYRIYRMSQEGKPDDFASMRELLMRHLSRAAEENTLPDLIVVDGGPAQLSQALLQRRALSLDSPTMIGLAKRRTRRVSPLRHTVSNYSPELSRARHKPERVFLESASVPIVLKRTSPALHLLERLRDEAHRFAITHHRRARGKRLFQSTLDSIPGVGTLRRKRLLREFGSVEGLRQATAEEISSRCRVPMSLAERIKAALSRNAIERAVDDAGEE